MEREVVQNPEYSESHGYGDGIGLCGAVLQCVSCDCLVLRAITGRYSAFLEYFKRVSECESEFQMQISQLLMNI